MKRERSHSRWVVVLVALLLIPWIPMASGQRTITLIAPNGGEVLTGGSTFNIEWVASEVGGYVSLLYSTDGGETYPNKIDCVSNPLVVGGNPTYAWIVPPNVESSTVRIKARWISACEGIALSYDSDVSDGNFTIEKGVAVRFTSVPETVSFGRYYTITWDLYDPYGSVEGLDLQLRLKINETTGWGDWETLGGIYSCMSPTSGGTWWTPPNYENATAMLKVRALYDCSLHDVLAEDVSNVFKIVSPIIILITPNGGETLIGGQVFNIEWRTVNDPHEVIIGVEIEYSLNGGATYNIIVASTANDFVYEWTVPTGISSSLVKIRVTALYSEWYPLASDESDRNNTMISDPSTVTVTLVDPNPAVDGGIILPGGQFHTIRWKKTGSTTDIDRFELYNSTDGGVSFSHLATATATQTAFNWLVPEIDNEEARIKVRCILTDSTGKEAMSNNNFYIYTTIPFNTPPVADAGNDQEVNEGELVTLDGTGSYDANGDPLTYNWTQVDTSGFTVDLSGTNTARPTFIPSIDDYNVTLLFELTVGDGVEHELCIFCTDRVSVTVVPTGPAIASFSPTGGWEGIPVTIQGTNLKGAEIYIGGVLTGTVPSAPTPEFPDPDTKYAFTILPGVPHGKGPITVRTNAGESSTTDDFEVFPKPEYSLNWGFKFYNPSQSSLSYPWWVWQEGRYRDTFGDDVYIKIWVCVGIPYYWKGWKCLGYEIEQPIAPDPMAAAYYGVAYWYLARNGECFGMSANSLQFYNGDLNPRDFEPSGSWKVNQLDHTGQLDRRIDYMHGSQVSAQALSWYAGNAILSLLTPAGQIAAMGLFLESVREAVTSGKSGIISMVKIEGVQGHAVVPYLVEDVDADHTRIYVYDSNRPWFSEESTAIDAVVNGTYGDANTYPPYIEIDKSGTLWKWSFVHSDGTRWDSHYLIFFLPYEIVNGRRTLPTSWDGMLNYLVGDATSQIEDDEGRILGVNESGSLLTEIPDAIPIPGAEGRGYALPFGNYTTSIRGRDYGSYNWSAFANNSSAFSILGADSTPDTKDTISLHFDDNNTLGGTMSYRTSDSTKGYSASLIKKFERGVERVYSIKNASIFSDSEAVFNTSDDLNSLIFFNNGPHEITYDVEFQTNMVSKEVADEGPITSLPTATRSHIVIGPYETHILTPEDWTNLDGSSIKITVIPSKEQAGIPILYILAILAIIAAVVILLVVAVMLKKRKVV